MLPRNFPAATLLPFNCQKFVAFKPFNAAAFTFVSPAPLPVKVPFKFTLPALFVTTLAGNCAAEIVPLNCVAATLPLTLAAIMAYGTGVNCWRGARVKKVFAALVLTASCSQLLVPVKTLPKSTVVVNRPLVTHTAAFVTGPAYTLPVTLVR